MLRRLLLYAIVILLSACGPMRTPVPPGVIPEQKPVQISDEQYGQQVLAGLADRYQLDRDDAHVNRVRAIADRLATAARADKNPWNVYVFDDPKFKNAAATRGNYIFVWNGILYSVQNDDELAGIIAHEMGHVLAGHTMPEPQEEVSRMVSGVLGSVAGGVVSALGSGYGILGDLSEIIVRGAVDAVIVNPDQRSKELEADQIGFFLMADAGYDPEKAVEFWERVRNDPDFQGFPIQFLSTHPSSKDRLERLRTLLPQAKQRYEARSAAERVAAPKGVQPAPEKKQRAGRAPAAHRWVVDLRAIPVFAQADERSPIVEDLPIDTILTPVGEYADWLHITAPVEGYVRKSDVSVYSPPQERTRSGGRP